MRKNYILCKMRISLLTLVAIFFSLSLFAQKTVSGRVTDDTGEALPGVTVLVKGTTSGAVTDANGNYSVNVSSSDVLVISYIGFQSQEIPVNDRTSIDISLEQDLQALQEVVVVGYGSQSKEEFTGSISVVPVKEAMKLPVVNVSEALQGRVAGVNVVSQGQPGEAPEVRIRGFASPNGNDPLYIIDGMQTTDPTIMNDINPADVENITVLKDAASTAIYGVRASNGIVVVTTKKGYASGKPKLNFEAFAGVQNPSNTPELLTAQQWANTFDGGTIPQFLGSGDPGQPYNFDNNRITPVSNGGTDWVDEVFDPAPFQNYYLSALGGSERGRYMMSIGYLDKEGVVINTGYDRISGRINSEFNITDNLRIGQHLNISSSNQTEIPGGENDDNAISLAYRIHPYIPVRDAGGNFAGNGAAGLGNAANPIAALERANALGNGTSSFRTFGDAYLEFNPIEDITLKTSIGINNRVDRKRTATAQNPEHSEPVTTTQLIEDTYEQFSWVWSNTAAYAKSFDNHNFNVLVGVEAVEDQITKRQIIGTGFFLETEDFVQIQAASNVAVTIGDPDGRPNEEISTSLSSIFGQLSYNFDRKYFASFSVRRDQTSRFTKANNTGVFPSASVAWALHRESFLDSNPLVSNLKLRFSYGETGNQSIARSNPTVDLFSFAPDLSGYDLTGDGSGNNVGIVRTQVGNPDLTWETAKQINFGLDFGLFQNDLSVSVDIYKINTEDMIFAPDVAGLPEATSAPVINIGEMENKGFDISISYGNYSKSNALKYDITANVSAYKNELVSFNDESAEAFSGDVFRGSSFTRTDVGNPISYFYGREVIGIFQTEEEVASSPDQGFATNADGVGRFKYRDVDGDMDIDDDDRTFLGSPHPDFIFGINAFLEYKNFDLSLFITGSQGNEIYNYTKFFTDFESFAGGNRSTRVLDTWTTENRDAGLPSLTGDFAANSETNPNSYFVEDGSYIRLKNVQIGYNIPGNALQSIKALESLRIYIQGTNLITITDYEGFDPEITNRNASAQPNLSMGIDFGRFPLTQVYTIGVKAGF